MTSYCRARLLLGLLLVVPAFASAQSVVVVDPAGPVRTVTEALTRVTPGGRITVKAGTYTEPVIRVGVPVTIVGDSGAVWSPRFEFEVLMAMNRALACTKMNAHVSSSPCP